MRSRRVIANEVVTMSAPKITAPVIRRLSIKRFRSIAFLNWCPSLGVNFILGGGDAGKTTILDAIALLLSPTNPNVVPDTDYYGRAEEHGFVIDALISLPSDFSINKMLKPSWPWDWNGEEPVVPSIEGDPASVHNDPVYWLQVTGTERLELLYEIKQPDGTTDSLTLDLRRQIGLVRLSGDDRNDRDLRFVQGSALDRLLSDKTLRSRLSNKLSETDVAEDLSDEAKKSLEKLNDAFISKSLPHGLDLAIIGSPGMSVMALIGLTAQRDGVNLPISSWGAGTRRLAALAIAEQNQTSVPITLVDEIERGLEPYRQRSLVEKLQSGNPQVFVTTHSAAAISAAGKSTLWFVDHAGSIGKLDGAKIAKHRERDPEAFLSRITIVGEGATEAGFVSALLEKALGGPLEQHGIHIADGSGHESTLGLLEALSGGGLRFGGFADDEGGKYPTRWQAISERLDKLLFRWTTGCLDENIINLVPEDKLEALIEDPSGDKTGTRMRSLQVRLEADDKALATLKLKAGANLKPVVTQAALGLVPAGKETEKRLFESDAQNWFKTFNGGRELAGKMFTLGLWPILKPQLLPFCNAVRHAVGLPDIADIKA
jgi:putative ATP-dependent endonuclease of the OLD family